MRRVAGFLLMLPLLSIVALALYMAGPPVLGGAIIVGTIIGLAVLASIGMSMLVDG